MPMTKKEKAELEGARVLAALRWSSPVEPDVMPPESSASGHVTGFSFNAYSCEIRRLWTTSVFHGTGEAPSGLNGSQGSRQLYSSRALALRAMRHEVEKDCARKLHKIDEMMRTEEVAE